MTSYLTPLEDWLAKPRDELREHAFEAAQFAATSIVESGSTGDDARDVAIRLRAAISERPEDLSDFKPLLEALTREVGLFPYLDEAAATLSDLSVREAFRSPTEADVIFHEDQQRIFHALLSGRSVVASAPTSFGKSLLIDSLIALENVDRAAIVVPTLALLDETRKRLVTKFSSAATVIFHRSQLAPATGKTIFVGTQERLLDREDLGQLDVLVIDEFYKADPSYSNERFIALNATISKLSRQAKQFFLIGPSIDEVDRRGWRDPDVQEIITHFRTVAADTVELGSDETTVDRLREYILEEDNQPGLIFVRSPKSASELAVALLDNETTFKSNWTRLYANWLSENYTPDWSLVSALNAGFAYHHGRLPRSVGSTLVRSFNRGRINAMLCTSTLIEGVNTAAKSVFIWDKTIDGKPIDYFTFSNIRGRAGRMGRHFVGKVFHFHPVPEEKTQHVEVPGLGTGGDFDELLAHYDRAEIAPDARDRLNSWKRRTGLNDDQLRRYSGLTFPRLERLKEKIQELPVDKLSLFEWHAYPRYEQLFALCELLWSSFNLSRSGAIRHKQLTLFIWKLHRSASLTNFLRFFLRSRWPSQPDAIFGFLRACEYNLPTMIMAAQESLEANLGISADYRLFAARLENWFLPGKVKALEEIGIPIVLFEKLSVPVDESATIDQLLWRTAGAARRQKVSALEMEMISSALPDQLHLNLRAT